MLLPKILPNLPMSNIRSIHNNKIIFSLSQCVLSAYVHTYVSTGRQIHTIYSTIIIYDFKIFTLLTPTLQHGLAEKAPEMYLYCCSNDEAYSSKSTYVTVFGKT